MYRLFFGRNKQVSFSCPEDYYELLGFLAKSDGSVSLTWENNEDQGAWGSEGRVCFHTRRLPAVDCLRFTAGNGSIYKRVNCNAFVGHLCRYHHFVQGKYQNVATIRKTIPAQYVPDFERGLRSSARTFKGCHKKIKGGCNPHSPYFFALAILRPYS